MISFVTWRWHTPGYRTSYGPETVNKLFSMVNRHYPEPHRNIVVTNDPEGIDTEKLCIEIILPFGDYENLPSPHGPKFPSCYRRLRMFHPDIEQHFGKRFVSLDLDTVITGDLHPLVNRPEDFVIWKGKTNATTYYNGSMILMTAGARPQVWTDFDPTYSPLDAKAEGYWGSDQAWISHCLGPHEPYWNQNDGVYSFDIDLWRYGIRTLPANARIVFFNGRRHDPWSPSVQVDYPWVKEHYR